MSDESPSSAELPELFLALRALAPDARAERLRALQREDARTAREVAELLSADESNADFLEVPALGGRFAWSDVAGEESSSTLFSLPARIGRYGIHGLLGHGGMGVVYRASQENPRREVALKVLRGSRVTPARLKRFEHEAELLARLQHPGIAQVYEAGTVLEDGRIQAFIAMELVGGADLRSLTLRGEFGARARLVLLLRIAEAVGHAHQKGVVHRDLKPENILVDHAVDAAGAPKIVDFGVARLVGTDSDLTTLHTEAGRLIGTPWYMSPEQLAGDPDAADTRSDVYALGVIGYELCAGRMPYELEGKPLAEVARVIRDVEPGRVDPGSLCAPDLEAVLKKCLEKEPARRYGSASELAADLARLLANEPVTARAPSGVYLLRKFVRRNRGFSLGIALAVLALLAGVAGFAVQARRVARERDRALAAERQARESLHEKQQEEHKNLAAFEFLNRMLLALNREQGGRELRVADMLAGWASSLADSFPDDPEVEADLRRTIGQALRSLGMPEEALRELRAAVARLESAPEQPAIDVARNDVALLLTELGRFVEAEPLYRAVLAHQLEDPGPRAFDTLVTRNNLAALRARLGDLAEAERLFREVLVLEGSVEHAGIERADQEPRLFASARRGLANQLQDQGQLAEARALLEQALADLRAAFGEGDAEVLATLNNLGALEAGAGNVARAIEVLEESRAGYAALLSAGHPSLLTLDNNLGTLLVRAGRFVEGEARLRAAHEGRKATLGPENQATLTSASNLGGAWLDLGRVEEAEELLRETRDVLARTLPPGHWMPHATGVRLGECWSRMGRTEDARALAEESLLGLKTALGASADKTKSAARLLARLCEQLGQADEAARLRAEFALGVE